MKHSSSMNGGFFIINPQRACARVTVVTFCVSVCLSLADFEDGFVLSLQTGIKAWQRRMFKGFKCSAFFENRS